ncbi:MAG: hypothetical protein A2V86_10270 [Deltaproteobacteria bacterium RBG_16_49_23]|nr:MAG: hypothetical protein A2V86_10270 [Deltaproteobacteria bacterium RBG_16_49_23]
MFPVKQFDYGLWTGCEKSISKITPVQNTNFTAETPRTQRSNFLFGGERPPNKKTALCQNIHFLRPYGHEKQSVSIPEG